MDIGLHRLTWAVDQTLYLRETHLTCNYIHSTNSTPPCTSETNLMDPGGDTDSTTHLNWGNVGLAFSFILLDGVLSTTFGLGVGSSLVTAAVRCVVQLSVVALILQKVFETNNPWAVAGMACVLNLMGTMETGASSSNL